jgi:glycosyltransferase involved in cell wall biosynthesis
MDVHGHSLTSKKWAWTIPLQRFLAKRALATVIDQKMYDQAFTGWGARTVVLERSPNNIPARWLDHPADEQFSVTVVSIFAADEPIDLVIEAARTLPDVQFHITGNAQRANPALLASAPANVHFTGYLKGDDYWRRMASSRAIMTLTTEPYSLVSGGIESMGLHKPTILSKQPVLEDYFVKGTVFVEHTVESLVAGIRQTQAKERELQTAVTELAVEKQNRWEASMRGLLTMLSKATQGAVRLPAPTTSE